jgi:glycosyltransferase involved in cell wall biosynthesis
VNRKPNILIVGDMPGWAFHNIIDFVITNVKGFDFYFDFTYNHPRTNPEVISDSQPSNNNQIPSGKLRKKIPFQKVVLLRGVIYRFINLFNRLGLLDFDGNGKVCRVRQDGKYDLVVYLDFYMDKDADFSHIKAAKHVKGIFTESYPPKGVVVDKHISKQLFCETFLSENNALLVGAPSIKEKYDGYFYKPILFANMAYDERLFKTRNAKKSDAEKFVIGWTGNPNRAFKGFHSHVIPTIEKLVSLGYKVELKTQFEGSLKSLVSFWQSVDLALIASDADAGPSMFMEASLCGVPTVSTRIGMPSYVIQDGLNGLFCLRDIDDMVEKVSLLINEKELYVAMKNSIRKDYIEKLGAEVQVQNWKTLFNEVLQDA